MSVTPGPWTPADDDYEAVLNATRTFEREVEQEETRLRARNEARRRVTATARPALPTPVSLSNFLTIEFPEERWRIKDLLPHEGICLFVAQAKAGKSTLIGNLVRHLADGTPFLGEWATTQSKVTLIDTELGERRLQDWLSRQKIKNQGNVRVMSLRGSEAALDPTDRDCRREWVDLIRGSDVVILDVVGPVVAALGLDENSNQDVASFWVGFRTLLAEAGVPSAIVVHHTGHLTTRAIGASSWLRYNDCMWKLMLEDDQDITSNRYFGAFGRDVDIEAGLLDWSSPTRSYTWTGQTQRDIKAERARQKDESTLAADVLALSGLNPAPTSQRDVIKRCGWGGKRAMAALQAWRTEQETSSSDPASEGATRYSPPKGGE